MNVEYTVIDFETANSKHSSACALGVALIRNNEIAERKYWLIRPRELYFDPFNVSIHGITEDDVKGEPEFDQLYKSIGQYLENKIVIAHNASFDLSVLRKVFDEYGIEYPKLEYYCTRVISKKVWPQLSSYSLDTIASLLEIDFKHHYAMDDASACAEIALRAMRKASVSRIEELAEKFEINIGRLFPSGYEPCGIKSKNHLSSKQLVPVSDEFDAHHPFFSRKVVFTGTLDSIIRNEAMQEVVNRGGSCSNSVTKYTSFLVMGEQDYSKFKDGKKSSKLKKAESIIGKGADLEIISESEFIRLLNS